MLIDGIDAKVAYGFALESAPGWMDSPDRQTPSAQVLKREGLRVLDDPRDQARNITLRGTIIGTSADDVRNKADAFKVAVSKNAGVQLTFDDEPTRYVLARCQGFKSPPYGPSFIQSKLSVEVAMVAHAPFSYDRDLSDVILWQEPGDTLTGEAFTSTSSGRAYFDQNGILQTVAANVKRDNHYINGVRTALRERAITNIVVSPRDLTNAAWVHSGNVPSKIVTGIDGVANTATRLLASGSANATSLQTVVLASSVRTMSAWLKRLSGVGTVEMTTDGGTTWTSLGIIPADNTWRRYRIPTQTLANPQFGFRLATQNSAIDVDWVQNEDAPDPTTPFLGTRNTEAGSIPWTLPPNVPITVYIKFIVQTTDPAQRRLFEIGSNEPASTFILYMSSNQGAVYHSNGTTAVSGLVPGGAPAIGDTMEVRAVLLPNGAVYVGSSKNGAAELVSATSASLAFAAAWSALTARLPVGGSSFNEGIIATKVFRGEKTMTQARAATRPTSLLLTDSANAMPLGTGTTRPVITITGAAVNPVLSLLDNTGATVSTMAFTVTMVAGDVLVIDCDKKTVTLNGVNRLDLLTIGDFFIIDPLKPGFDGAGPTFTNTSGAFSVSYRRAWR